MAEKKKCLATVKSQSELAPGIYSLWLAFPEEYKVAAMANPGQILSLYSDDGSRLLPRPHDPLGIPSGRSRHVRIFR